MSHTGRGRSSERRAALLSCATHALLALGLVWLGARQRSDESAPAKRASEVAPGVIEIEVAPAVPLATAPAPLPETAPAPPERPAPAPVSSPAVSAPARPQVPRVRVATARPPATPGRTAEPAAVLAMRSRDRARPSGEPDVPLAGPDQRPAVPDGRPWPAAPRGQSAIDLSPAQVARRIAPDPGPPPSSPLSLPGRAPAAPEVTDSWAPAGEGTYRVDDIAFTARIARDGQVTIDDKPSFELVPNLPRVREDPLRPGNLLLMMDIARFDVTDWLMRRAGMDPYSARKARFLDQTRDARAAMRAEARREELREAIAELPALLDAIWRDSGRTAAQRRELMFHLWDECTETGSEELVAASRTARATILGFIRRALPEGSADAYTAAELESLNAARKSRQEFAPYE
jgi:hypothetical protein